MGRKAKGGGRREFNQFAQGVVNHMAGQDAARQRNDNIMQAQPRAAGAAENEFANAIEKQRGEARAENDRLTGQLEASRRRNAIGMRRARRGNVFEEGLPNQAPFARNLGGGQ